MRSETIHKSLYSNEETGFTIFVILVTVSYIKRRNTFSLVKTDVRMQC